jgi:hypothetical protein
MVLVKLVKFIVDVCDSFKWLFEGWQLDLAGLAEERANFIVPNFQ